MATKKKLLEAAAGASVTPDTGDPEFANVALLLDGDGTSGDDNNTFTDSSTNGFTVTENGSVVQGSFSPYGDKWSVYFENDTAFMQADTGIDVSTDNFTIEMWVWATETDVRFCSQNATGGTNFYFGTNATGNLRWDVPTGTSVNSNLSNGGIMDYVMPLNQWVHVAAVREGTGSNQFKMYADGVLVAQSTDSSGHGTGRKINIAGGRGNSASYDGYISNFRFVVGSAVYTSAFTPPTEPLTNITNTKLLACQSNRFIDNSATDDTFTLDLDTGLPKVTPFSPFKDDDARTLTADGGSGYFDGSSNDLTVPNDSSLQMSSESNWTIEFWAYFISSPDNFDVILGKGTGSGTYEYFIEGFSDNTIDFLYSANGTTTWSGQFQVTPVMSLNEWFHVALVRNGATFKSYVNGVEYFSGSSFNIYAGSGVLNVGGYSGATGQDPNLYLSDVRLVKGTAVYTSAFTPPTSPLTAITNTSLLLNFQDAGIYDLSGINNLDTVGDAKLGFAPIYGTGALEFDGSGDYLLCNSSEAFGYGTGDFTLECWIYKNANPSADAGIIEQRPASTNGNYPMIGLNSSGQLFYYVNAAYKISASASTALSNQAWDHVAYVRSGGNLGTLYINGTSVGTWVDTTNYVSTTPLRIGEHAFSAAQFNGFIDDLRITKGVARYTANFTPPTEIDLALDTHAEYVTFFLDGDGPANGQNNTFTDSSTNGFTVTESGSVVQGVFSPYGDNWSNYFVSDLLSTSFSAIGSSDFTLEFWAMVEEDTTGRWFAGTGTGTGSFQIGAGSGGKWSFYTESNTLRFNGTTSIAENTWYHVAVSRSGSTIKLFINGSEEASATDSVNYSATSLGIGGYSSTNASCYGYISNFRIVVGTAVYTSAFTPSTTPLTAITNTKLLTCQSNRFVDNSSDGNAISVQTGTPKVTRFSPFESNKPYDITTDGGSGNFDGSSSYLAAPSDAAFAFGTGDYTIEAWVYPTTIRNGENLVYVTEVTGGTSFGFNLTQIYIGARGVAYDLQINYALKENEWTHIAACRDSGTVRIFANGALVGSGSVTRSCPQGAGVIGQYPPLSNYGVTGYIADPRVIKGTAFYTSAFTPPTAPLTSVTNTSLLLNFQDSAIPDLSGLNNIDTVGNAKVGASDPTKYGTNAMQFDGSSDYLEMENTPELDLSGGEWTVECWVYPTADYSTYRTIFTKRFASSPTTSYQGYLNTGTGYISYFNGATYVSSTALTSNTWSHCAWVYDGTNINIYVNGTSVLSTAVSVVERDTELVIGGARGYNEWFGGYLDDFRITKGIARYTANFTPPSEALPKF